MADRPSRLDADIEQPLIAHLAELRNRLLRALACVFLVFLALSAFANDIYALVAGPLAAQLPENSSMIATEVAAPFLVPFKLAFFAALFISMPYLLYQVGPSPVRWEPHRHWEGLILPVDDEFWEYASPPNGFGCKCRVLQLTSAEADRLEHDGTTGKYRQAIEGKEASASEERTIRVSRERPPRRVVDWTIPSTGLTTQVTVGIDPDWDYHPGRDRSQGVRDAMNQYFSRLLNVICPETT